MRASNTAFLIVMVLVVGSLFYALSFAFYPRVDSGTIASSIRGMSIIGSGTKPPPHPHSCAVSEQKRTKQLLVLMKSAAENIEMRYPSPSHDSSFAICLLLALGTCSGQSFPSHRLLCSCGLLWIATSISTLYGANSFRPRIDYFTICSCSRRDTLTIYPC